MGALKLNSSAPPFLAVAPIKLWLSTSLLPAQFRPRDGCQNSASKAKLVDRSSILTCR